MIFNEVIGSCLGIHSYLGRFTIYTPIQNADPIKPLKCSSTYSCVHTQVALTSLMFWMIYSLETRSDQTNTLFCSHVFVTSLHLSHHRHTYCLLLFLVIWPTVTNPIKKKTHTKGTLDGVVADSYLPHPTHFVICCQPSEAVRLLQQWQILIQWLLQCRRENSWI
jgi:hypothetical protein